MVWGCFSRTVDEAELGVAVRELGIVPALDSKWVGLIVPSHRPWENV